MPIGTINSSDPTLQAATTKLNASRLLDHVARGRAPVARFVNSDDIPHPPAPAWYLPETADIYIHVGESGINAANVIANNHDLLDASDTSFDIAKALGLLAHEGGHAAISDGVEAVWEMAPKHRRLLTMFEELRVENHALRRMPELRSRLRASFTIVLGSITDIEMDNTALVAHGWGLIRGRTLAGIATSAETDPVDSVARTLLGDDVVDELVELLQEALTLDLPRKHRRMIEICDEWVALVGADSPDEGCAACSADGSGAKGTPADAPGSGSTAGDDEGDGEGSGSGDGVDELTSSGRSDDAGGAHHEEDGEGHGLGEPGADADDPGEHDEPRSISEEGRELARDTVKDLSGEMHEQWMTPEPGGFRANSAEWSSRIFGSAKHYSSLTYQEPTVKHRQDVVKVAGVLSNLAMPAVAKTVRPSVLPPGRLRSRETVRAAAERAQGQMVTARPWKGTVRRHSSARPLVVGIATDTSGSMGWAEQAVADFAYVYANAGHRIGARTAAVTFGSSVRRIARPGEVLTQVVVKSASDGEEQCDYALAALDGVLHLTKPSPAARILLVVSDGALVRDQETAKVSEWLTLMNTVGTHIIWLADHSAGASGYWLGRLASRLENMTVVAARKSGDRYGTPMSFDELNTAAMAAVTQYIR